MMENEEGMNHLWIELPQTSILTKNAILRIYLPKGLYRGSNLNGNVETKSGEIILALSQDKDVFVEMYTQSKIDCDEALVNVELCYQNSQSDWRIIKEEITVHFVDEDEVDSECIDQQVIERVIELGIHSSSKTNSNKDFLVIKPRTYEIRDNEYTYLEKNYRINY